MERYRCSDCGADGASSHAEDCYPPELDLYDPERVEVPEDGYIGAIEPWEVNGW